MAASLMGLAAMPAQALADSAVADSVVMVPRVYRGETVMVPESSADYTPEKPSWWSRVRAMGAIQTEFHVPIYDEAIMTPKYDQPVLNNTFFDFTVNAPYISVGARFQWTKWPLPGLYEIKGYAGWGVPYFWATGRYKWLQVTAGDFYEQFGSGLILRTYQDRALGVDGALRGGRIKLNPVAGLYLTGLVGKERYFWHHNPDLIWGADAEWSLDETFARAFGRDYGLTLGFSYVGKHQDQQVVPVPPTEDYKLRLPEKVAAFDGRVKLRLKDFNVLAEFATKNNDPNGVNKYIYAPGHTELLSLSFAWSGFSGFIQAKRSQNMSYMSDCTLDGLNGNGYINHLPAFTATQTYTLAALYPYTTDWNGEWAFQAQIGYLFKRGTALGGKYGTTVRLAASYISDLYDSAPLGNLGPNDLIGTDGLSVPYWKIGSLRYADLNFEINKKFSRKLQFTLFYLFQRFNQYKIFGESEGGEMQTANTFILEGQWKMAKKMQLRCELQYLTTKQDRGDWFAALLELSLAPNWMFTVTDTYNIGKKMNYYSAMVTFNYRANRFSLAYGRNRAGFNCAGGVCRWVPATNGFNLTYNFTF